MFPLSHRYYHGSMITTRDKGTNSRVYYHAIMCNTDNACVYVHVCSIIIIIIISVLERVHITVHVVTRGGKRVLLSSNAYNIVPP